MQIDYVMMGGVAAYIYAMGATGAPGDEALAMLMVACVAHRALQSAIARIKATMDGEASL